MVKRKTYLDILRIMAIFFVIMIHVASGLVSYNDFNSYSFKVGVFIDSISFVGVPLFYMISGALFLDDNKNINYKKLYSKNILRLVICFIVFSIFYNFYCLYTMTGKWDFSWEQIKIYYVRVINDDLLSGSAHLWFMYNIIPLYMIMPIIKRLIEGINNKRDLKYLFMIIFLFVFITPTLSKYKTFEFLKVFNFFGFDFSLAACISYFIIGHYLDKHNFKKDEVISAVILGSVSLLISWLITVYFSINNGTTYGELFSNSSIAILLISMMIFILVKTLTSKIKVNEKIVTKLSSYIFGVYLVHLCVMSFLILNTNLFVAQKSFPILMTVFITILIFLISLIYPFIVSHIPVLKKYLM